MRTYLMANILVLALVATGCMGSGRPFDLSSADRPDDAQTPSASASAATRVDAVGQSILAQNKVEFRDPPVFMTIGLDKPMIFHRSPREVVISEGLVRQCATDAELAGVLCHELGLIAAEQQEQHAHELAARELPPAPRLAPDVVGASHTADMTRLAEEAKYDRRAGRDPKTRGPRFPRPDPKALTRQFFTRAGHKVEELDAISGLIKEAEANAGAREVMRR